MLRTRHEMKVDRRDYHLFLDENGLGNEASDEASLSTLTSEEQDRKDKETQTEPKPTPDDEWSFIEG